MKQIINKYTNGSIRNKYYLNHLDQMNGTLIYYWNNGNIWHKANYINDKLIGLDKRYNNNNKPYKISYYI